MGEMILEGAGLPFPSTLTIQVAFQEVALGYSKGDRCQIVSDVIMREGEDLYSTIVMAFDIGLLADVVALPDGNDRRRLKVEINGYTGWISSQTLRGEPLIKKLE